MAVDILTAIKERHSVRRYKEIPVEKEKLDVLFAEVEKCNAESGLHIQLVTDEPKAFTGIMANYGHFSGVSNYFALVGKKSDSLDERVGYYGERLVLLAQSLGLNTCWVALTFSKRKAKFAVSKNEKLVCVISLGYGEYPGNPHKNRPFGEICSCYDNSPDWFKAGIDAAMLAPTAINQQKFSFSLSGNIVTASALKGPYSKVDLGIVKLHFELGAGKDNFSWADK